MKLLVVEDEPKMARLLERGLREEGHTVDLCDRGDVAFEQASRVPYDVVVLDWSLPEMDGLTVLRRWRERGVGTPVLLLTARGTVGERVTGLRAGADDYLVKPFDFEELVARIEALHRRGAGQELPRSIGPLSLDVRRRALARGGDEVSLTAREMEVLSALAARAGDALTRSELLATGVGAGVRRGAERGGRVRGLSAPEAAGARGRGGLDPGGARGGLPARHVGAAGAGRVKVQTRLLLFGAVVPSAAMIAAVLLAGLAFRWSLLRSLDRALLAHAAVESVSLFDGPGGQPHVHLPKSPLAGEVRSFAPVTALFDGSGALVARFPESGELPVFHARDASSEAQVVTRREAGRPEMREVLLQVTSPDGRLYVLQVASSVAEIDEATRAYYGVTLAFCLSAALGLGVVQVRQARRLSRRVTEMAAALPRIRGGDVEWRLPPDRTGDEVADLRVALSEAMDRVQAARGAQERLIANAAHELRTPLGVMRTELDLALRRERSAEELRAALGAARDEVDRLGVLAARLLDLASFGRSGLAIAEGDAAEVAREAAAGCEAVAEQRSIRVVVAAEEGATARFDGAALRQAIDNLLSNALRFAPEGSTVRVSVERGDGRVAISVSDEGPGVPPEEAARVFEPFYRRDRRGGAGLGLAIVAEIARGHGGRAYLAPSGKGARFVVEIAA